MQANRIAKFKAACAAADVVGCGVAF
jgi:hypothetical protein